jgi:hypothetical protein
LARDRRRPGEMNFGVALKHERKTPDWKVPTTEARWAMPCGSARYRRRCLSPPVQRSQLVPCGSRPAVVERWSAPCTAVHSAQLPSRRCDVFGPSATQAKPLVIPFSPQESAVPVWPGAGAEKRAWATEVQSRHGRRAGQHQTQQVTGLPGREGATSSLMPGAPARGRSPARYVQFTSATIWTGLNASPVCLARS